jgi:hypothetical protein
MRLESLPPLKTPQGLPWFSSPDALRLKALPLLSWNSRIGSTQIRFEQQ